MRNGQSHTRLLLRVTALAFACSCTVAVHAAPAKFPGMFGANGVSAPGSPYRYTALSPRTGENRLTIVAQIDTRRDRISRWWHLRGAYQVPALTYNGSASGISADGGTLVLSRFSWIYPPRSSGFAILDTDLNLRHPVRAGERRPPHAITRVSLPGGFTFHAISPDGSTIYLSEHLARYVSGPVRIRALDASSGELLPPTAVGPSPRERRARGVPIARAASGHWAYTLYTGYKPRPGRLSLTRRAFVHALDTVTGRAARIDLPQLDGHVNPFNLALRLQPRNHKLTVLSAPPTAPASRPLLAIDTGALEVDRPGARRFATFLPWLSVDSTEPRFLGFTQTPRRPGNLLARRGVAGRSAEGRPIGLLQRGDPSIDGEVLVFGCVHGDECGAREIQPLAPGAGCPDPASDVYVVPNLNPDGLALDTRLNGRGVDLNRNFPAAWKPIGERGGPQHSGPRPFSEPETRLAARIVERLRPEVTIWFHQHYASRPLVRAWGQSVPAARRYARLAKLPFRRLPWLAGTAPHWQNRRFAGTASFVVEMPRGVLSGRVLGRLGEAVVRLGREVGED
jgi:murein peptide amidase A